MGSLHLTLGSASPRRRELLARLGLAPDAVLPADIDETPLKGELPRAYALRMGREKALGVAAQRVVLDPGIGFGKTVAQNFQLLARQAHLIRRERPLLAGWSRKSSLGAVLSQDGKVPEPAHRQAASVAAALLAVERGSSVVRVHDVKETVDALKVWQAMRDQSNEV